MRGLILLAEGEMDHSETCVAIWMQPCHDTIGDRPPCKRCAVLIRRKNFSDSWPGLSANFADCGHYYRRRNDREAELASLPHAFEFTMSMLELQMPFQLESNYKPRGDQGQAIAKLLKSVE